jgi:hypothetical protein
MFMAAKYSKYSVAFMAGVSDPEHSRITSRYFDGNSLIIPADLSSAIFEPWAAAPTPHRNCLRKVAERGATGAGAQGRRLRLFPSDGQFWTGEFQGQLSCRPICGGNILYPVHGLLSQKRQQSNIECK